MRKHLYSRINFCHVIITLSLFCVSCKYVDDKFLLDEQSIVNVDSVENLGYLSQSENVKNIETMDTLTAIFDEKGNAIDLEKETLSKDNNEEKKIEDKNIATKNGSQIVLNNPVSTNNTTNDKPNQKTVNKSNSKKAITKKEVIENNQERDYRLQKSNHAIPDL